MYIFDKDKFLEYSSNYSSNKDPALFKRFKIQNALVRLCYLHSATYYDEYTYPSHSHQFYELCYVVKGSYQTHITGHTYTISEGQFFIVPPFTEHSHSKKNNDTFLTVAFAWEMTIVEDKDIEKSKSSLQISKMKQLFDSFSNVVINDTFGLIDEFYLFERESSTHQEFSGLDNNLSLFKLLIKIATFLSENTQTSRKSISSDSINKDIIKIAVNYIEEHYHEDISGDDVAAAVNLSCGYLGKLIKRYTGLTIVELLTVVRLQNAERLLFSTEKKIVTIAQDVGFSSESYFINCFKKRYNQSPIKFRQMHMK